MRILYVNALYPTARDRRVPGGAETFAKRLVGGLVERGHDVVVVRSGTSRSSTVEQTADGVTVHSLPCLNFYPAADGKSHNPASRLAWHLLEDRGRISAAFGAIVADFRPDVLHSNNVVGLTTDVWRVARAAGLPIVHTLHDYYLTCPKVLRFSRGARCDTTCRSCSALSQQRRRAAAQVDLVVGVSQRMLDIHREEGLFAHTASEVILNVPPPRDAAASARPRQPGRNPVFGFIGRQAPEKGIFDLLEAFCRLPPGSAGLRIAGTVDPAVERWVQSHVPAGAAIDFTGYVTPEAFFPTIDIAVFPSIWEEPCSMGVGEALSFGVPVLGSRRGGTPELLEHGRYGWLFQPGTDELSRTMEALLADSNEIATKSEIVGRMPRSADDQLVTAYLQAYGRVHAPARLDEALA